VRIKKGELMTWRTVLKLDFRDTVFRYDKDMVKLKNTLDKALSVLKDTYSIMLDEADAPTIEEAKKVVPNFPEEFKQQISLIMSHLDEIKNEQDKDKRHELIDEIIYPSNFKGTGSFPNDYGRFSVTSAIVEYLASVIENYNEERDDWYNRNP